MAFALLQRHQGETSVGWQQPYQLSSHPALNSTHPEHTSAVFRSDQLLRRGFPFLDEEIWHGPCKTFLFMVKTEIRRKSGKFSFLLWWLSAGDLSYLQMYSLYGHEYATPPQHCFLLIILISDCKIRKQALVGRDMLFLGLIDKKKQKNYSTICSPCASEPT